MADADEFDLQRFVTAQDTSFSIALAELEAGRKRSHWMWFIFPQMRGLGSSAMATLYGIASRGEAKTYLAHPVLGPRLQRCTQAVLGLNGRSLNEIFGSPDDMKFCSSMTLFAEVAGTAETSYRGALDRLCDGRPDARTMALLQLSSR